MTSYLPAKVLATGVLQVGDLIFFAYITELWIRTAKVYGRKKMFATARQKYSSTLSALLVLMI